MKNLLAFILSIVMIAALAGCSSKPAESSGTAATAVQTTEAPTTQPETIAADVKDQLDQILSKEQYKGILQISKAVMWFISIFTATMITVSR